MTILACGGAVVENHAVVVWQDRAVSSELEWTVIVPVKASADGKSRLVPPPGVSRSDLAAAFSRDTLSAVLRTPYRLVVVTEDDALATWLGRASTPHEVVRDRGGGLNAALRLALSTQQPGRPTAILLGDLPCVQPDDLVAALRCAARHRVCLVSDHHDTGTVLLASRDGELTPRFGSGSAARHAGHASRLDLDLPRLRLDVDDHDDLRAARRLGVGPFTTAVLAAERGPVLCRYGAR